MVNFLLPLLLAASTSLPPLPSTVKVHESATYSRAEVFIGSEYRDAVNEANKAVLDAKDPVRAMALLQPALDFCDSKKSSDKVTYISVSSKDEAEEFARSHPAAPPIVILDSACAQAYRTGGFIAVGVGDVNKAFYFLDKAQSVGPYRAGPYVERGFLLGRLGRPAEALVSYRKALELASARKSSGELLATALRGVGYMLVELGDLEGAKKAYLESLAVEPSNALAKEELEFIEARLKPASDALVPVPAVVASPPPKPR